jgi:hypothetical protein
MPELTAAALRLLEALAAEGAYGFHPEPDEPGILAVVGQRNGISLRRASAAIAVAGELERSGFAAWRPPARSRRRRFVVTERGWAKLAETAAATDGAVIQHCRERVVSHAEAEICP